MDRITTTRSPEELGQAERDARVLRLAGRYRDIKDQIATLNAKAKAIQDEAFELIDMGRQQKISIGFHNEVTMYRVKRTWVEGYHRRGYRRMQTAARNGN